MNYQEMSDFEISRAAGHLLGVEWSDLGENYNPLCIWVDGDLEVFDPCNSWADAGSIAQENKISVLFDEQGTCHATHEACWVDGVEWQIDGVVDENPCRAICIVFLMMKGGDKNEI